MSLSGIVEIDETYVGGPRRRRAGRPGPNDRVKTPIIALVERGGRVRAFPLERVTGGNIQKHIRDLVQKGSHVMAFEDAVKTILKAGPAPKSPHKKTKKAKKNR